MLPSLAPALPAVLERNLRALAAVDRDLARRLLWPVGTDHVVLREPEGAFYRLHRELVALAVTAEQCEEAAHGLGEGEEVFLFGLGLGELADHLCRNQAKSRVVAWDRDPYMLRLALGAHDYSAAIRERRIRFSLGVDLVEEVERATAWRVLAHPLLGRIYSLERTLFDSGRSRSKRAALALGGLMVDDLALNLADAGYEVLPFDLDHWSLEEIQYATERYDPDLLVVVNYKKGLAEFCEQARRKLVVWEIDPSTELPPPPESPTTRTWLCTWRRAHVRAWREAGFSNVRYLPLASDPRRRRPLELDAEERARYGAPLCFVGASMVAEATDCRRRFLELYTAWHPRGQTAAEECDRALQRVLDRQREDYSRNRMPELVEQELGDFLRDLRARRRGEDPLLLAAEVAAAEKRLAYVAELGAQGIHVWGDAHWKPVEAYGARYRGPAGHREELTKIYNAGAIHVDIGRLYQTDIVTLRVFDVLACGAFLIAEHSEALAECFELGVEVESYKSFAELVDKIAYYRAHPDEARLIAELGLAAVRNRHTIRARVGEMLAAVHAS